MLPASAYLSNVTHRRVGREHSKTSLKEVKFPHPGWCKLKFPTFHLSLQKAMFLESTDTLVRSHWSFHPQHTALRKHHQPQPVRISHFNPELTPWPLCTLSWLLPSSHEHSRPSFPACTRAKAFMGSSQHPTIKSGGQHLTLRPSPISQPTSNQWQQSGARLP